jgi:Ca-activated chloride channel family protein
LDGQFTRDLQFFLGQYDLRLLNPQGLWLLLGVPVFFVLGLWMGEDLRWWRKLPIQVLRAAAVVALTVAYTQPVQVRTVDFPAVVLLADLSDSVDAEAREKLEQSVREFWRARGEAATYLVGFGLEPSLLAEPSHRQVSLPGDRKVDGTDIAAGLRFAYGLFPPLHDRRVVIFSDGEQTRGDLLSEAVRALAFDIQVSVVPIVPAAASDVRIDEIQVPDSLRSGEKAKVRVELAASGRRSARVVIKSDGERVALKRIDLVRGNNSVEFEVELNGDGWHTLAASVFGGSDRYPQNNWAAGRTWVFGKPKVTLVQAERAQTPLGKVIGEMEVDLQVVTPAELPTDLAGLSKSDLVVLDDLPLGALGAETVERLQAYVEEFGGGLLVIAGQSSSDLADPDEKPIERILPVQFKQVKKKEEIPAALVFVTDRSSSMARGSKFVILLRAVADTLDRLKDTAQVAVVMFDDFPELVVPLTEAQNRDKIRKVLMSQRVGGGTSMYPALEMAHKQLKKSAAKLKHVILLSDGQSISLYGHYGYIVDKLAKDQITVTTVAMGEDADQEELKRVAARSGGRFYFTTDMDNVPKIFTAETENITETNVIEQTVHAKPAKLVQALAEIDFSKAPAIKGYLASEARPTGEVLLMSSDRSEPLLARWRFGLGRVMVLTTDAQGSWSPEWPGWEGFSKLWPRLLTDTIRRSPPGQIRLAARADGDRAIVTVRVPAEKPSEESLPPSLTIRSPSGQERPAPLTRRGLGTYRAEIELSRMGPYALRAERIGRSGAQELAFGSVSRSYAEEYLSAQGNAALLSLVAERTGGQVNPDPKTVFGPGRHEREQADAKWPPFVLLALALFLGEVLIRRL